MRPCLTGTRSGSRVVFCSTSSATGSGRSAATCHPEWLDGGTRSRVSLPLARRSSRLGCATFFAAPTASVTVIWSTSCSVPLLPRARPEQGHHLIWGITGHHSHHFSRWAGSCPVPGRAGECRRGGGCPPCRRRSRHRVRFPALDLSLGTKTVLGASLEAETKCRVI